MIKVAIIDDEKDARILLRRTLEGVPRAVNILGEADDVDTGLDLLKQIQPDLVFLDIQMRKGTGFDLLMAMAERPFEVVFVTAYNQYALRAFQFAAFSYLLKPLKRSDLEAVLDRFAERQHPQTEITAAQLEVLHQQYRAETIERIVLPNSEGFRVVPLVEILYLEADRNYTRFYLQDGSKELISKTLKHYESLLHSQGFYRIHQTYLIQLRYVDRFRKTDGGLVEMINGASLPIARQRKAGFLRKFA